MNACLTITISRTNIYFFVNKTFSIIRNKNAISLTPDYSAKERLGLSKRVTDNMLADFARVRPEREALIGISFLSDERKDKSLQILGERFSKIFS
ncbi:MAG: hypothetical protein KAI75_07120 [Desulfobulbaceae bacterium]|nr:hypothetical protein [Desulfobulbaceae bacterium]